MRYILSFLLLFFAAAWAYAANLQPGQARICVVAIKPQGGDVWVHWRLVALQPGPLTPRLLTVGTTYRVRCEQPDAFHLQQELIATPTHGLTIGPEGDVEYLQWSELQQPDGQPIPRTQGEGAILSLQGPVEAVEPTWPACCTRPRDGQ